jgi:hypothetical protein
MKLIHFVILLGSLLAAGLLISLVGSYLGAKATGQRWRW